MGDKKYKWGRWVKYRDLETPPMECIISNLCSKDSFYCQGNPPKPKKARMKPVEITPELTELCERYNTKPDLYSSVKEIWASDCKGFKLKRLAYLPHEEEVEHIAIAKTLIEMSDCFKEDIIEIVGLGDKDVDAYINGDFVKPEDEYQDGVTIVLGGKTKTVLVPDKDDTFGNDIDDMV